MDKKIILKTKTWLTDRWAKLSAKKLKKLIPGLYILIFLFGLLLTGVHYAVYPTLITCTSLFGEQFCTPTGIFIAVFASIPGYLIAGNVLTFAGELPSYLSFLIIFTTSLAFYYFLGWLLDKKKGKKLDRPTFVKTLVITLFLFLLLLLSVLS